MKTKPIAIISDIHCCFTELEELLNTINYKDFRIISLGDILDRYIYGPECLRLLRSIGAEIVCGNHDSKAVRWMKHHKKFLQDGTPHPMKKVKEEDYKYYLKLTDEELDYLANLPPHINFAENWYAVHGGFQPFVRLDKQKFDLMIRCRFVDAKNGKPVQLPKSKKQPDGSVFWTELYDLPHNVIYGHHVHQNFEVRIDKNKNNTCIGIDTGCVFGGHLTAAIIKNPETFTADDIEYVKIKAKNTYYQVLNNEE
ncbi:MAG: metallophosphoesterase [Chitinophagales bacterium]|nr:metallophosphoesterase [Chitinophagales bacterium]